MSESEFASDFDAKIQQFAGDNALTPAELSPERAVFPVNMDSGRQQVLFVRQQGRTFEFVVPSMAQFPNVDEVPGIISTLLLQRNVRSTLGFWCLANLDGQETFCFMHNVDRAHLDSALFGRLARRMVAECDEFDGHLLAMLKRGC